MSVFKTDQEEFWSGSFGDDYIDRNKNIDMVKCNITLLRQIIKSTFDIKSVIEFGSNIGLNLLAIRSLLADIDLSAIEINAKAVRELRRIQNLNIYDRSLLDFVPDYQRDFVFTKGVLIHINPDMLNRVYDLLYQTSKKYICLIEYYNSTPVDIMYRGHKNKLFKRDFPGEMLDKFKDLKLIDYGFVYHRDPKYHLFDDMNWFLIEKS
ncbi:MAG: pseudaminic acid biosynthesis-associated methylase [Thermodesulfovibrionales bacterium]